MPLLHLPVQSGSTKILQNMNRNHTIEEYFEIIDKLKKNKPSIKFSSDFIIAYPGETKDDFEKTVSLMKQVEFINSYSFIFSARPGTPAANLKKIDKKLLKKDLLFFKELLMKLKQNIEKNLLIQLLAYYLKIKLKMKINILGEMNILTQLLFTAMKI